MQKSFLPIASNIHKSNQNDTNWHTLSDKEKLVLIAMLVGKSDTEAIKNSPVKKTQYFEYKRKLEPLRQQLISEILKKAMEMIQGNTIKAAEVLTELLDSTNPKTRQLAAESILDRTIGKPHIAEQQKNVNQTMNFTIVGVSQEKIDRLFTPRESKQDNQ